MLLPRVIPCLDIRNGRVVKGVQFQGLRDAGDPVERALTYEKQGADELALLDVSATPEGRGTAVETVRAVRAVLSIPLTVGGGIRRLADAERLLDAGADKIAVNSAAVERPALLAELSSQFGAQCTVLALDAGRSSDEGFGWEVFTQSGRKRTGMDVITWARESVQRGAGEILLTSWDRDGTSQGYDLDLIRAVTQAVAVPVIASGGAASATHLAEGLRAGASAVLAASMLHDSVTSVGELKRALTQQGMRVRI
ncbi:MAG: cyclase [Planctomycetota bacterium]|jgi:cyclase